MTQIKLNREKGVGIYKLEEIFEGLKDSEVLLQIFQTKEDLDDVFLNTVVIVDKQSHYMYVKNKDASIVIGRDHLRKSEEKILYLDIIHELVHVRQQRQGLDLYDETFPYVDRSTEIEAYVVAVKEARKLGMKDEEIFEYLHVEWISHDEHQRLASHVGLSI